MVCMHCFLLFFWLVPFAGPRTVPRGYLELSGHTNRECGDTHHCCCHVPRGLFRSAWVLHPIGDPWVCLAPSPTPSTHPQPRRTWYVLCPCFTTRTPCQLLRPCCLRCSSVFRGVLLDCFKAPCLLGLTSLSHVLPCQVRVMRALQLPQPILLEGSPGVGKTSLISALAKASGHNLVRINLSEQTDIADLLGCDLPVASNSADGTDSATAPDSGEWLPCATPTSVCV